MTCEQCRPLLEVFSDGELDPAHHALVVEHLRTCPACTREMEKFALRRSVLAAALPRRAAPDVVTKQIQAIGRNSPPEQPAVYRTNVSSFGWLRDLAAAASLLAAIGLGYSVGTKRSASARDVEEAVAIHVRSLQANHLTDVASTDQHTVRPWFAGRLDFSPPVLDLAAAGFPLVGGRLERVEEHAAAALVYRRRQHTINVLVWPANLGSNPALRAARDGYQIEGWTQGPFHYVAISEISSTEFESFVSLLRTELSR